MYIGNVFVKGLANNFNMKKIIVAAFMLIAQVSQAQNTINNIIKNVGNSNPKKLSNNEIISGLKEALNVGTKNATNKASITDGFFKNPLIKIPFPKEVKQVETTLRNMGINKPVDDFIKTMNRAAEDASKKAAPIFVGAITKMTIQDGLTLLNGGDTAATSYLRKSTSSQLATEFKPVIKQATTKAEVTKYWTTMIKSYNKIPMVKKVNPDLDEYITQKALSGLFTLVGQEETKIRKDPMAQITNLLKKVFGS